MNELREGVEMLEKALKIEEVPDLLAYLAMAYEKLNWQANSSKSLLRLEQIDPNHPLLVERTRVKEINKQNQEDCCCGAVLGCIGTIICNSLCGGG
jgi:hypothetical protein